MDNENLPFYKRKLGCVSSFLVVLGIFFILFIVGSLVSDDNTSNSRSAFDTDTTNTPDTETPVTVETKKEYQLVTTFTGEGDKNTESFSITSDKVKLVGSAPAGIFFVKLSPDDDSYIGGASIDIDSSYKERTAETIYRNLESGSYYLKIIATKSWKVEVYQEIETPIVK